MGTHHEKITNGWHCWSAPLLSACGGGGGSPGTNSNGVAPSKAASVAAASATTLASSGLDGTEVTLTAIVKDAGGNALPNETVSFNASSGTISSTNRVTNSSGQVVEKLSVKGDSAAHHHHHGQRRFGQVGRDHGAGHQCGADPEPDDGFRHAGFGRHGRQ
jgi:hypothetical protein